MCGAGREGYVQLDMLDYQEHRSVHVHVSEWTKATAHATEVLPGDLLTEWSQESDLLDLYRGGFRHWDAIAVAALCNLNALAYCWESRLLHLEVHI